MSCSWCGLSPVSHVAKSEALNEARARRLNPLQIGEPRSIHPFVDHAGRDQGWFAGSGRQGQGKRALETFVHGGYIKIAAIIRIVRNGMNSVKNTDRTLESGAGDSPLTPSTALLKRRLGISPAPRMLTPYEIGLLRRSKREMADIVGEALAADHDLSALRGMEDTIRGIP